MEYRPTKPEYWDESALERNLKQAFDICNGCRLCHDLCPSFPALFRFVEGYDDDAASVTRSQMEAVADECFQCKICALKCPYTPPHRFDLDFPRLMLRTKAQRVRRVGLSAEDRFLGDPERSGRLGTAAPHLANWAAHRPGLRGLLKRRAGIDPRRRLPPYADRRFSRRVAGRPVPPAPDVVLFSTCTTEFNYPELGEAAIRVLEHQGLSVATLAGERCCGMPALDGGDVAGAQARAQANIAALAPHVERGARVAALQPTCTFVLKREYPLLVEGAVAERVAAAVVDVTDFLAELAQQGRLASDFQQEVGAITYHVSCHTRMEGGGGRARRLLSKIPGTTVVVAEACAGIDGTWGLKARHYDASQKVAARLMERLASRPDDLPCSDCKLAGLQIETAGRAPLHPVEVLARAYGFSGAEAR